MLTMKAFKKNQQKTPSIFRKKTNNAAPDCPRSLDLHGIKPQRQLSADPPSQSVQIFTALFHKISC